MTILRFMETSGVLGLGQRNIENSTSILSVVENHSFWLQVDAVSHTQKKQTNLKAHCDNSNAVSPLNSDHVYNWGTFKFKTESVIVVN